MAGNVTNPTTPYVFALNDIGGGDYGTSPVGGGDVPSLTATTVSQDQVDVAWVGASPGFGIEVSRSSTSANTGFSVVYYADEDTASVSLYSHQEGSKYWYRARFMVQDGTFSNHSTVKTATTIAATALIYVATAADSPAGNDSTGTGSIGAPYLTIQKAVQVAVAGNVISINRGTYTEVAEWDPALGVGSPPTAFSFATGVALHNSGDADAPIIIQPTIGDEGLVILDQSGDKVGFFFDDVVKPWPDYIHIKGIEHTNCFPIAIWSLDSSGDWDDGTSLFAQGVVIEGNTIHDTTFDDPQNVSAIRMDSNKEWTLRNNTIDGAIWTSGGYDGNGNGCIYGYNCHEGTIVEFNDLRNGYSGVYWKDTTDNILADTLQSTIRYNTFTDIHTAIYLNAGSAGTGNPGFHNIRRNIFKDVFSAYAIFKDKQEARADFHNNFVDYGTFSTAATLSSDIYGAGVSISASSLGTLPKELSYKGNIMGDTVGTLNGSPYSGTNVIVTELDTNLIDIQVADYNIYETLPRIQLGASVNTYVTLDGVNQWRAQTSNAYLTESAPGANSLENQALSTLATDASTSVYTIPALSPALAFMDDGSNAGPYQYGNSTVIGVIP